MNKEVLKLFGWYILSIFLLIFFTQRCNAQTIVNDKTFNITMEGVSVVEFWAEWNKDNECDWLEDIEGVNWYRIDVDSESAKKYEVTVLPTLLLLNDGDLVKKYEGNVSFEICPIRTPKKLKKEIKKLSKDE